MNRNRVYLLVLPIALIVLNVLAACATAPAAPTSVLSEAQATAMAENALAGLNAGDYAAWSRDWDAAMRDAIQEADFLAFRDEVMSAYGQFVSIGGVTLKPGQQAGNVRWEFTTHFEKGDLLFAFAFAADGDQIKGVHPAPIE